MKNFHMFLIIVSSIVVLEYNLSAFVQPLWFEDISEVESVVSIKDNDIGSHYNVKMDEFEDLMSQRNVDLGYEDKDLPESARI